MGVLSYIPYYGVGLVQKKSFCLRDLFFTSPLMLGTDSHLSFQDCITIFLATTLCFSPVLS